MIASYASFMLHQSPTKILYNAACHPRLGDRLASLSYRSLSANDSSSRGNALAESGSSRHIDDRSVLHENLFTASGPYLSYFLSSFSSKLLVRVDLFEEHSRLATTIPASFARTSSVAHRAFSSHMSRSVKSQRRKIVAKSWSSRSRLHSCLRSRRRNHWNGCCSNL